ncbi:SDR family NAD(P)-dependent oxidoreductase, partial [Streptomyces sp. NPDC020125]|uniref:SDR family NAD(P)-dependent oxidoreductase n=1 Tax=Streptomyces sp. NPDC020125 TaxID=3154593 RepID=UPI0033C3A8CD
MSPQATAPQHPTDRPRVAIVTGGSRGIGHEAVKRLAADGYAVVVGYAGHREPAEAAAHDIAAAGGRAVAGRAAVGHERQVVAPVYTAEYQYGGVDEV